MTPEEIVTKWAKCIMQKTGVNPEDEYNRLEIMNCMMLCFKELTE